MSDSEPAVVRSADDPVRSRSPAGTRAPSTSLLPFDATALQRHRALVSRMAQGEVEALQLLYLELAPVVSGVVRRMLADSEDARETLQDAFIKAWRNAGSFRPERGEAVAWLVFIARHAAIDRIRQGARRRQLRDALLREADQAASADPACVGLAEEVALRLAALPERQRRALELAFFEGCTQAQIATVMQTAVGNVKNHLRRGLQKLRELARRP